MTPERRQTVRFRVSGTIEVRCPDSAVPLSLVDLGGGGFSTRSSSALPIGAVMRFQFGVPGGEWQATLTAKSVYSRWEHRSADEAASYVTGFAFLNPETPTVMERINALIDRATAIISFS